MWAKLLLPLITLTTPIAWAAKYLPVFEIVGGRTASQQQIPYQVSMEYDNRHKCGGSILSKYFILTAAHCTNKRTIALLGIRAGSTTREWGGQLIGVKTLYQHPMFNDITYDYDVSILELENPLTLGRLVKPINLPKENEPVSIRTGTASGWGQLSEENLVLPIKLQFVELPIWKRKECKKIDPDITERMFCAGFPKGGKDTCTADSGGPLACRGKLIGIVSWGYGCGAPQKPGVYIKVASVRKWIKSITNI